jgi:hypothetical protein
VRPPVPGQVLVDVVAADGRRLEGLLSVPAGERGPVAALLHLHGKGGNFYSGPSRFLPRLLAREPLVHLSLNMRCHDLGYTRYDVEDSGELRDDSNAVDGGFWERLDEGRLDVAAGVDWLRQELGLPVFVTGHSAGGFYLGDYSGSDPGIAGRILLSPLTSTRHPLSSWFAGNGALEYAAAQARRMVAAGRGHHLLALPQWFFAISAASLLERVTEKQDRWVTGMNGSHAPVLLVWGDREERGDLWRELFARVTAPDKVAVELAGCGHSYLGREVELAEHVARFVGDRTRQPARRAEVS